MITSVYRMFYEFPDLVNQVYPGTLCGRHGDQSNVFALVGSWQGARIAMRLNPAEAMRTPSHRSKAALFGWNAFLGSGVD